MLKNDTFLHPQHQAQIEKSKQNFIEKLLSKNGCENCLL